MKKLIAAIVISTMLVATGAVFGQADSHEVEIRIPEVLALRITSGSGNTAASDPAVVFNFLTGAAFDDYLDALDAGSAWLPPTTVTNFGDVVVFANRGTWNVRVSADDLDFVDDVITDEVAAGIALADIRVTPSGTPDTNVSIVAETWNLTTATSIANGIRTEGWRSLGFSGNDYEVFVDGDEAPGSYLTIVTYEITAP